MMNTTEMREKAAQLRAHAAEYAPSTGWPLLVRARALERLAAELDRNGRERRQPRLSMKDIETAPRRPVFGRRGRAR